MASASPLEAAVQPTVAQDTNDASDANNANVEPATTPIEADDTSDNEFGSPVISLTTALMRYQVFIRQRSHQAFVRILLRMDTDIIASTTGNTHFRTMKMSRIEMICDMR
jgi:hypothetical protein